MRTEIRIACGAAALAVALSSARAADVTLSESGSTLLYPLFTVWVSDYTKTHPGVEITAKSSGSGAGIEQALARGVEIGTSDAYLSDAQARQNPQLLDVPLAISALSVNFNVPELKGAALRLDGPTLAAIYTGRVSMWDDKAITGLNPALKLPHHAIVPVHRADGSGDTFVFTQYLAFSTPAWEEKPGFGTSIAWPAVEGAQSADGNTGVLKLVATTPYSLTYLGVSFHTEIEQAGLGTAQLKSYDGEYLSPSTETISAAAAALTPRTPADERLTLVNAPGAKAYPLVNYEYAMVSTKQQNPETARAIKRFLLWAIAPDEDNDRRLADAHFIPLPAHIWVMSHDQLEKIR